MKFQPVHSSFALIFILLPLLVAGSLFLFLTLIMQQSAFAQDERCFASLGNSTEYASVDAQAVRAAIAAAPVDGVVKIAGRCRGAVDEGGTRQVALLTKTVVLRGGYTPTDWTNSQPAINQTILDALRDGRVISTSQPLTIANLIIQNGSITSGSGGGLYADSDLWLINSQISNNQISGIVTDSVGGGLFVRGAAHIVASTFLSNTANAIGGGALLLGAAAITGTTFRDNRTRIAHGGGLVVFNRAAITATNFLSNSAGGTGGGAIILDGGIVKSVFLGNRANLDGGALAIGGAAAISSTSFISNTAQGAGGALYLSGLTTTPMFVFNSLFARNQSSAQRGDAVYFYGREESYLAFRQNTVAKPTGNDVPAGVALAIYSGTVDLINTIITNHSVAVSSTGKLNEGFNLYDNVTTRFVGPINSSINSSGGASNFVDSANDNYHLAPGSDAIDRGMESFLYRDLDGAPRPQGYAVDIGAYEAPTAQANCFASADGGTTVRASGDSSALKQAIDDAVTMSSSEVRVAGRCAGVARQGSFIQVALISKTLTLVGGYAENNWSNSNPSAHPTTLDALQSGRVIFASLPLTVVNLTIQNGFMGDEPGGGIFANSDLRLVNSQVNNNAVLTDSLSNSFGGGVVVRGVADFAHTTFFNNRASAGGAAALLSDITITQSRFLANQAKEAGGALYLFGNSTTPMRVVNTLFASNRTHSQQSDSLYLLGQNAAGHLALLYNTLANPSHLPSPGAALGIKAGTVGITNTIIAYHGMAISNSMGLVYEDYNLYDSVPLSLTGPITPGAHSFVGASSFADSANHDYHLLATSAALDAGVDVGISDDFDGAPRPQGNGFDIGAFEWDTRLATVSIGNGSATEGDSGFTTLTLPVNLGFANALTVTVQYSTTADSATDGVDYTGVNNGTLTFAPHVATQNITINILGDTALEGDEHFTVTLGQPHFATIGDGVGQATIIDNELAPTPTPSPTVFPGPASRYLYLPVVKR